MVPPMPVPWDRCYFLFHESPNSSHMVVASQSRHPCTGNLGRATAHASTSVLQAAALCESPGLPSRLLPLWPGRLHYTPRQSCKAPGADPPFSAAMSQAHSPSAAWATSIQLLNYSLRRTLPYWSAAQASVGNLRNLFLLHCPLILAIPQILH